MKPPDEWVQSAFKHAGRCVDCDCWTRHGVRRVGGKRLRHLCGFCARNAGINPNPVGQTDAAPKRSPK